MLSVKLLVSEIFVLPPSVDEFYWYFSSNRFFLVRFNGHCIFILKFS